MVRGMAEPVNPDTVDVPDPARAGSSLSTPAGPAPADAHRKSGGSDTLMQFVAEMAERARAKREALEAKGPETTEPAATTAGSRGLLPVHHPNRDFFLCDLYDISLKDDGASMEVPLFSLKTQRDLEIWRWESKDKLRSVTITPSVIGRATQFDKDVLIFLISEMTAGLNLNRFDAHYRTVRFHVHDYFVTTNKRTKTRRGGVEYERLQDALARLRGTTIQTNIKTGGIRVKDGFGFIDSWSILEKSPTDGRMNLVAVTLSEWLYNAVQAREVLTINPAYFRIRGPTERRIYELSRKHCGAQPFFSIGTALLHEKAGGTSSLSEFRRLLRGVIAADSLPDYRLVLDEVKGAEAAGKVLVYNRDVKKLAKAKYRKARRVR